MWKLPDGTITPSPRAIEVNGVQYPATIFKNWTAEELGNIGVYSFREDKYDPYFYSASAHTDVREGYEIVRKYTLIDAMTLAELKERTISDVKITANNLLAPTDWYVIRKIESNTDMPTEVSEYRTAVRQASNDIEAAISNYATYAELVTYITGTMSTAWPSVSE